jgi:zinc transport system substrate-binding protein
MVAISKARLYFAIDVEFEAANLDKIVSTNPLIKVVHTDQGIKKIPMAVHHHHDEKSEHDKENEHQKEGAPDEPSEASEHGEDHHEHGGLDRHIWLSPPLVKIQARAILNALQGIDPAHRTVYEANYRNFIAGIDQLDAEQKTIFVDQRDLQ